MYVARWADLREGRLQSLFGSSAMACGDLEGMVGTGGQLENFACAWGSERRPRKVFRAVGRPQRVTGIGFARARIAAVQSDRPGPRLGLRVAHAGGVGSKGVPANVENRGAVF